jgi:hypothetical protein
VCIWSEIASPIARHAISGRRVRRRFSNVNKEREPVGEALSLDSGAPRFQTRTKREEAELIVPCWVSEAQLNPREGTRLTEFGLAWRYVRRARRNETTDSDAQDQTPGAATHRQCALCRVGVSRAWDRKSSAEATARLAQAAKDSLFWEGRRVNFWAPFKWNSTLRLLPDGVAK